MKVSIIGMGHVGAALAYTVTLKELADELVLVDRQPEVARGHALDLRHAHLFLDHRLNIHGGDIEDTAGSDVVVICASAPWREGFVHRNQAAEANTRLFEQLMPPLAEASPDAKLIVASNPVDVLTWHAIRLSGFEPRRVMGSGTLVDSARLRELLAEQVGIHPQDLRAYMLGEHGQTQFAALSIAEAGGEPIEDRPDRRAMIDEARQAGLDVFRLKGDTSFAISMAIAYIIDSIRTDARHTMPLSVLIDGYYGVTGVCLSVPVVVGRHGIERWLAPTLNDEEQSQFRASAAAVREVIDATG